MAAYGFATIISYCFGYLFARKSDAQLCDMNASVINEQHLTGVQIVLQENRDDVFESLKKKK